MSGFTFTCTLLQTGVVDPEEDLENLDDMDDDDFSSTSEDTDEEELRQGKSLHEVFRKWDFLGRVERKVRTCTPQLNLT